MPSLIIPDHITEKYPQRMTKPLNDNSCPGQVQLPEGPLTFSGRLVQAGADYPLPMGCQISIIDFNKGIKSAVDPFFAKALGAGNKLEGASCIKDQKAI